MVDWILNWFQNISANRGSRASASRILWRIGGVCVQRRRVVLLSARQGLIRSSSICTRYRCTQAIRKRSFNVTSEKVFYALKTMNLIQNPEFRSQNTALILNELCTVLHFYWVLQEQGHELSSLNPRKCLIAKFWLLTTGF